MNETMKTINSLRSIHGNFSGKEISDADLDQILNACIRAANASARQSYSIIVLNDRNKMQNLFGYQGSKALIFSIDFTRIKTLAEYLGHAFDNDDIIGFITGTIDTILAVQTAVIAAKSLGIDSLITNGLHRMNLDKVYEILQLPESSCFPLISIVLGYPQQQPEFKRDRLDSKYLIHFNKYNLPSEKQIKEMINEYDDHSKHIGLIENWEELGFKHYLDWYYTKWAGEPVKTKIPTGKILEFQERLIKCGFWWPVN